MATEIVQTHNQDLKNLGCVIIGRNEGDRLRSSFESIPEIILKQTVYVDSGSTDGSQTLAKEFGLHVLELDRNIPFTAARARNKGAEILLQLYPQILFIQFIDGDCALEPNWLNFAANYLERNTDVAIVCGRRREKYPESSIYNWLCDVEWDTPTGETQYCGGDFCITREAFILVDGFNDRLIAGEEPDLCFRLRNIGKKIHRVNKTMTWHDANIKSLKQWMIRAKRGGYAYAEAVLRYSNHKNGYWRSEFLKTLSWGLALPLFIISSTLFNSTFISLILLYPLNVLRIAKRSKHLSKPYYYGLFMLVSKFPETIGIFTFFIHKIRNNHSLIEYK